MKKEGELSQGRGKDRNYRKKRGKGKMTIIMSENS